VHVAPCIYLTHRRADVWGDPAAFRPERFLGDPVGPYAWIPFGGGVRRCLGAPFALMEMEVVLEQAARLGRLGAGRADGSGAARDPRARARCRVGVEKPH
jgi:cytochrome P450